jgi:hypothetical protein
MEILYTRDYANVNEFLRDAKVLYNDPEWTDGAYESKNNESYYTHPYWPNRLLLLSSSVLPGTPDWINGEMVKKEMWSWTVEIISDSSMWVPGFMAQNGLATIPE